MVDSMRDTPEGFEIVSAKLYRTMGRWMLGIAVVLSVGVIIAQVYEPDVWPLWILPGVVGPFGLFLSWAGVVTVVRPSIRTVQLRTGPESFDAFVAVILSSGVREVSTEHGTQKIREFGVGLVSAKVDSDATRQIEAFRKAIDESEGISDEDRDKMMREIARWESTLTRAQVQLATSSDEHDAWRIGERLAKAMELPMVDFSGGVPVERTPQELDLSLGERLRAALTPPEPPGPAPHGITMDSAPAWLVLRWKASWSGLLAFTILFLTGAVVAGVWLGVTTSWVIGGPLLGFGAMLVVLMMAAGRGRGANELRLAEGKLHHVTRFPWPKRVSMSLNELEHVRQQTEPHAFVSLVSDAKLVRLLIDEERGTWLVRKLEHWLVTEGP